MQAIVTAGESEIKSRPAELQLRFALSRVGAGKLRKIDHTGKTILKYPAGLEETGCAGTKRVGVEIERFPERGDKAAGFILGEKGDKRRIKPLPVQNAAAVFHFVSGGQVTEETVPGQRDGLPAGNSDEQEEIPKDIFRDPEAGNDLVEQSLEDSLRIGG